MSKHLPVALVAFAVLLLYTGVSHSNGCGVANVRAIYQRAAVQQYSYATPVVQYHAQQYQQHHQQYHQQYQAYSVYNAGGADALEIERLKLEVARTNHETAKTQLDVQKLRLELRVPEQRLPDAGPRDPGDKKGAGKKGEPAAVGKISCIQCHNGDDNAKSGGGLVFFTEGVWSAEPYLAGKGIVSMMKGSMPKGIELTPEQFADHIEFLGRIAAKKK